MTKIYKKDEIDNSVILEIAGALNDGQLVVFPTDTVYGIGTNAFDGQACEKIYEVKGRPMYKPLVVLVSDISMLRQMVDTIDILEQKLMDTFWPGPLTIKFKKKDGVLPDIVSAGDDFVRVRLIGEGLLHDLIQASKVPVVAPSANLSGSFTGIKIDNIVNELGNKVDYILDCGDYENDITSTIVQIEDGEVVIIREGKIKADEIAKIGPIKNQL